MTVFVDTSGLYAVLDADDRNHGIAAQYWAKALGAGDALVSSSCVLVEAHALVERRLGMDVLGRFQRDIVPILSVEWVDEQMYSLGAEMVLAGGQRSLSLVDCISFFIMERLRIRDAFSFDAHFRDQGFECRP
jgi:predicted nucleic acid-binding protein